MGEQAYLDLVRKILNEPVRKTRNANVMSVFGESLEFDLCGVSPRSGVLPLFTTKFVSFNNIFHELMFFLKGLTNTEYLNEHGVKIWNPNSTREFLDKQGLHHYPEGTLGPIYGHQWRNFGAEWPVGVEADSRLPTGVEADSRLRSTGVDQIKYCINLLQTDPFSRRILFTAWNPVDLPKMALYPCHILFQFYVRVGANKERILDGQLYQRSADLMLGVPYNVVSYSLLIYLVSSIVGMVPGRIKLVFGDVHIYEEHREGAEEQLRREVLGFPKIHISHTPHKIEDFRIEDITIDNYVHGPPIKMKMVA